MRVDTARAEIRRLATVGSESDAALLAQWAAYYRQPDLALELLTRAAPRLSHPGVLWESLMHDVRKLPAFNDLMRDQRFVDYWRAYQWSDYCRPLSEKEFD